MPTIYAPIKATVKVPGVDGKPVSKTVMLNDGYNVSVDSIIDAIKATAGIVDSFAKGYHIESVKEDDAGDVHISVIKTE